MTIYTHMEKGIARGVGSAQNAGERPARGGSNGEGREQHPPTPRGNSHQGSSAQGGAKIVTEGGTEATAGGVRRRPHSYVTRQGYPYKESSSLFLQSLHQAQLLQAPPLPQQQPQNLQGDSASTSGIPRAGPGSGEGWAGSLQRACFGESEMARVKKYQDAVVAAAKAKGVYSARRAKDKKSTCSEQDDAYYPFQRTPPTPSPSQDP